MEQPCVVLADKIFRYLENVSWLSAAVRIVLSHVEDPETAVSVSVEVPGHDVYRGRLGVADQCHLGVLPPGDPAGHGRTQQWGFPPPVAELLPAAAAHCVQQGHLSVPDPLAGDRHIARGRIRSAQRSFPSYGIAFLVLYP